MTSPNFRLLGGNNALAMFQFGANLGQQATDRREAREQRNALLQVRQQEEARLQAQAQREAQQAEEAERRADLPMLGRLLDFAKDEQTYQQARSVAQRYGIDMSQVPETFDPNWIAQQRQVVQLLQSPQGQEALSTAGKQAVDMGFQPGTPEFQAKVEEIWTAEMAKTVPFNAGGGVARVNPVTGEVEPLIVPNPGNAPAGAPVGGGYDEWEVVQPGGSGGNAAGGFPGN